MLNVFSALLDAATLSNSWIVVDRTLGEGGYSATAEYLLELALERGSRRPTIIVIDSIQRLREASGVASDVMDGVKKLEKEGVEKNVLRWLPRSGQRSFVMHNTLKKIYDAARKTHDTPKAKNAETEQVIDFQYDTNEFTTVRRPSNAAVSSPLSLLGLTRVYPVL